MYYKGWQTNISPVSAKLCMLLNKTTARAYYDYVNNKLPPFSSAILVLPLPDTNGVTSARVSQIVKMALACTWDGKLHRIYFHPIILLCHGLSCAPHIFTGMKPLETFYILLQWGELFQRFCTFKFEPWYSFYTADQDMARYSLCSAGENICASWAEPFMCNRQCIQFAHIPVEFVAHL